MTRAAICAVLLGLIPWTELKSWASWHIPQEHGFWEHEHSSAGSIASTEESAKTWEILHVPAAETGQRSVAHNQTSVQGSEHTSALHR